MKKILLSLLLFTMVVPAEESSHRLPVIVTRTYDSTVPYTGEDKRFLACENIGGAGFYWLNTETADLWQLNPSTAEWIYLGSPRGADSGRKGTYQLLPDRHGGVYVLNTDNGEGWWTDGSEWKNFDEPSRRIKRPEN